MKSLTVRELLKNTYESLERRNPHQEIALPEPALSLIADDSDWHRTRRGYMKYEKTNLFQFNGKKWAISRGESYGSYPARPYDSDFLALELSTEGKSSEQIQKELIEGIGDSSYFRNSLICGMADGNLILNSSGKFGKKMLELLKPKLPDFVTQKPEYDTSVILASTLQHPTIKEMLYKPTFVGFLTETIETILKEFNEKKEGENAK